MALTDVAIRKARKGPKAYKLGDSAGLFLLVEKSGGKLWRMKYRIDGREKKLAIGRYPEIGLAEARYRSIPLFANVRIWLDKTLKTQVFCGNQAAAIPCRHRNGML